jgi:hypothetical protein
MDSTPQTRAVRNSPSDNQIIPYEQARFQVVRFKMARLRILQRLSSAFGTAKTSKFSGIFENPLTSKRIYGTIFV